MTTYTQEHIEKAYELGRMHERHKMADLASLTSAPALQAGMAVTGPGDYRGVVANGARKRPGRVAKASSPLKTGVILPKVPKARSSRKDRGPREKGVKAHIVRMIAAEPMTAATIIERTGFKSTSVRATLMSLKKAGLATIVGDGWIATGAPHVSGNSEGEAAASA